jgi:hypothetical protein
MKAARPRSWGLSWRSGLEPGGTWARPERTRRQDRRPREVTERLVAPASRPPSQPDVPAGQEEGEGARSVNGRGLGALACGFLSLLFMVLVPALALILGAVAVALGLSARRKVFRGEGGSRAQATFGVLAGGVGLAVSTGLLIATGMFVVHHTTDINQLQRCVSHTHTLRGNEICQQRFTKAVHHQH